MKHRFGIIAILCVMLIGSGCSQFGSGAKNDFFRVETKALDTFVSVTVYGREDGQEIAEHAMDICSDCEMIFSRTREESLLYRANQAGGFDITDEASGELAKLIQIGVEYGDLTEGALDITVMPLSSLWNFGTNEGDVPSEEEIRNAVGTVDYHRITFSENRVDFNGAQIELGAIAKGYIADKMAEYLIAEGVTSALINLGGNILAIGGKSNEKDFMVGIQMPFGSANALSAKVGARDLSLVTSGVYERYFKKDGRLYHHILDPKTGYPCENGLYSVTILAKESTRCDALSTGCFVLGLNKGMELINSLNGVEAIMIDSNQKLHYSDHAAEYIRK